MNKAESEILKQREQTSERIKKVGELLKRANALYEDCFNSGDRSRQTIRATEDLSKIIMECEEILNKLIEEQKNQL